MTHGLWGHALFLASKMDERSYSRVMLRFANGLDVNDPLQTLYQLMSGRLPIAVKVKEIHMLYITKADLKPSLKYPLPVCGVLGTYLYVEQ